MDRYALIHRMRFASGTGKRESLERIYRVGARSVVVLIAGEGVNGQDVLLPAH